MQRAENIIGATAVATSLLYVHDSADPVDLLFFALAVAVCGITSSYSELHGYKFRYALLGPAILPCLLLVTAAVRARCLALGLVVVWIMRSAVIGFWYKVGLIGALCYWILAFMPLGYASVDVLSLVIAGLYGALHTLTDLTHTEKVFASLGLALMLRWNYQLLSTSDFAQTQGTKERETMQTLGLVSIGLSNVILLGLIPAGLHAIWKRAPADKLSYAPKSMWVYAAWAIGWIAAAMLYPMSVFLKQDPLSWIVQYLFKERAARGVVCLSWLVCLCTALPFIHLTSQRLQFRRHISRKIFHFLAAVMFFLVIEQQRPLMSLALGVALCGLLVAEYIRVLQVPVLGPMIQAYYTDFIDSRDNRKLILTHIYLLVGCASTVWLSEALSLAEVDDVPRILPHLGWITIGVGDSMGAIVGVKFGKHRWLGCQRTIEGSLACLVSMALAAAVLSNLFDFKDVHQGWLAITFIATTLLEAFTDEIDNLLLPAFSACLYVIGTIPVGSFYTS